MQYQKLCEVYEDLAENSSRLTKTKILSDFLKTLKKEKNKEIIYLLQGTVFPENEEKEFGISSQLTIKALGKASGLSTKDIVSKWRKIGDLGTVAKEIMSKKSQSTLFSSKLTTDHIIKSLIKLPEITGKGAVDRKTGIISELLTSASPIEAKYIVRTLLNDLRVGIASGTLRDAIVWTCFDKDDKEAYEIVQAAYDKATDFKEVFEKSCKGKSHLMKVSLAPGKAVKVMLAQKAENIEDGFNRVGKPAAFEFKYDGFRMMINKDETGEVKIFTRRLDNVSKQFPDVVKYVKTHVKGKSFLIDCEAVGFDPKTNRYLPFQNISKRIKRKYEIERLQKELPIELNVFYIIYYDGKSLISEPFESRTKLMRKIIKKEKWKIKPSELLITSNAKEAETFYQKALEAGEEGIMIKNLQSPYKPGSRVGHMLKYKPEMQELDLVITGAEYGTGKRAGWLSSFDLACKSGSEYLGIGKVGTGFKEKAELGVSFLEMTKLLKPLITETNGKHVNVKPKIVISIIYQNIQKSPTYKSGFAFRFPRMTALRSDRSPSSIATLEEIKKDYEKLHK